MAQWRPIKYETKREVIDFGPGMMKTNALTEVNIPGNYMAEITNMDSKDSPALSVRPPHTFLFNPTTSSLNNPLGYGSAQDRYHLISTSDTLMLLDTSSTAITNTICSLATTQDGLFAEIVTGTSNYVVYLNSTNKKVFNTSPAVTTASDISDTNLPSGAKIIASYKGRMYVLKGKTLYYSALNNPVDWTTANDAGSIVLTNMVGYEAGLVEYNDELIIFASRSMHLLQGSGPATYQIKDLESEVGCYYQNAITKCQGVLYWIAPDGIFRYDGARPVCISEPVKYYVERFFTLSEASGTGARYRNYVAGSVGRYVNFAISYRFIIGDGGSGVGVGLLYDTLMNTWSVGITGKYMKNIQGSLYGVSGFPTGLRKLRNMVAGTPHDIVTTTGGASTESPIEWSFMTKPFIDGAVGEPKTLTDLYVIANITTNCTSFNVGYSTTLVNVESTVAPVGSSTYFVSIFSTNAGSALTQVRRIQVPVTAVQNAPWYRLRLWGTGPVTINYIEKIFRTKRR